MKKISFLVLLLVFAHPSWLQQARAADTEYFLAANASIDGRALGDWGASWWQWLKSFARSNNPQTDLNGALCTEGQVGDVWFLAGAPSPAPVERECTIPPGKTLFFPALSYIYYAGQDHPIDCATATTGVAERVERPVVFTVSLNGDELPEPLQHREATTRCFDPLIHTRGDAEKTWAWPGASDGYYFALKPLPPGKHVLRVLARGRRFGQDITYTLTVLP